MTAARNAMKPTAIMAHASKISGLSAKTSSVERQQADRHQQPAASSRRIIPSLVVAPFS